MKNIFTKTLTLIALLSLSIGVWGANIPSSLSFDWNSYGNGTSLSGTSSDKVILDGDFEWSGVGESNLKHSSGYCLFKGDDAIEVAQSRQKYTFQKGTYQVEIACMVKEDKKFYTPIVVVDQNTWNKSYETHPSTYTTSNPEKKWTETLEIVVPAAGDYYVRAQFKSTGDEKCGAGQISFTYKGGGDDPTPPGPTPTCSSVLTIPCANNYVPITDRNDADPEANSASYGTYEKQTSTGSLYYYVNLPNGTYTISATYNGSGDVWCNYFKKGDSSNGHVSYKGTTYGNKQYHKMNDGNWTNLNLSGEYLISIGCNGAEFTNIIITEQNGNKVFCSEYEPMTRKMYFKPNSNWHQENEFYQIYFIEQGGDHWSNKLTQNACDPTIYETKIPKDYTGKVIYVRLDASKSQSTWDSKWDQTGDLSGVSDNKNYFDVSDWDTGLKKYTPSTYTVTYAAGDHGTGTMTDSKSPYACGSNVTVLANGFEANGDYEFDGYSYNSNNYSPGDVINGINSNITLTAQWKAIVKYTITVESSDENKGTVTGGGSYKENTQQEISATPNDGYGFYQWNDGNTDNPRTITVTGNATYTASFKAMVCTNTLTWEAEDESKMISPTGVTTCEYYKDKHCDGNDASSMVSSASDGHFISMKQNASADSKCIYYHFSTSETADLAFTIRAGGFYNNKSATIILYSTKQPGSQIFTYDDKSYKKVSEQVKALEGSDQTWNDVECTFTNQPADDYVVAVHSSEHYWTIYFDKFTITASENVFCTEAPAVTTWSVYGNFDGDWKDYEMTDGVITIPNISRASNYQFKLRKTSDEGENYTYYGAQNQENNMTSSNCTNWTLTNTNNGYDIKITTGATGSYTFTATDLTGDSPNLSVTYPTAYSITFDDNDADGGTDMTNITNIASGGSETLPTMTRTKTGYRFIGWKDASGNDYADGATIENITSNITLTAQWETVVTVVTVTAEGGVDEIMVGNTLQMSVAYTPSDAAYGRSVTWSSSNTNLATISNEGLVSALQPGLVTITATSLNGVQGNYNLTIVASACGEGVWKMTYWPEGSGNKSEYCFTQIGETHEWRRDYTLPSVADWFSIGQVGGANDHSKDWTFNALTTIGLQSNKDATKYYPGQDAVGYLRIFDDSGNDNYYVAFEPIYQALFGIENGSDPWTVLDFEKVANTDHEYETSTFQVPAGYKNNDNYKYYVGTKRANGTSQFVSGKSNSDKLNTVSGLKDSDMSGKYGKFHIWDNSADNNWYCEFKRYYRLSYSGEGTEGYNPHDVYSDGSSSARTVTLGNVPVRTGYNISGWTIGGVLHPQGSSYEITDDATAIATWTPIVYHITYNDVEGATNTNPATYTIENTPIALQNPEKTGYDFVKWTIEEEDITTIAAGTTGDLTLTAHWTPTVYYITYEGLDGAENTNPTTYTIESETINFVDPGNRTGYTFNSWDIASIAHGSTGNKTITASWNLVNYSITYHDATTTNPTSYTIESSFDLTDPSPRTGFTFLGWYTDAQFTNQITAITAGMHENKDIYAKWENAYCSNTFTIQCEDDIIRSGLNVGSEGSTPNGMKVIPDDEGPYDKYPNYTGRGYIDLKGNTGATYYAVHLPAATYSFDIYKTNGGNKKLRLYSKSYGSDGNNISYNGTTYKRIFSDQYSTSDSEGSFTSATVSNKTLQEDDYIVALYSEGWASYDKIVITANSKVFCPEMYTVTFPQPEHGTVTAAIKDGAAISSGDEVPENTVVVFTASDIAEGYELVNWTDGESHELAGAVNSFEQKITSNITVNANIEEEAEKYTVTVIPGDHGSITSGAGEYREGATVTIVTAPAANYKVGSATASNVDNFTIEGNNVSFTMPAAPVAVTINFVFDEVHALIITPNSDETYTFGEKEGWASKFDISSVADPTSTFDHNVLKLEYDGMSGQYAGRSISKDAGYTPNAKATGFAFWYRTEKSDDGIAFCFQKTDGNQTKWQMQATNGEWRYYYWEDNDASNYATNANFKIYMNGSDGGATTKYNSGTYYITEIQATNVTSQEPIVPKVNLTVTKDPDEGGNVTTSPAEITNLEKGTPVTLTATPNTGYRFVNWTINDVEVSTDAEYNYTVNANTTITANFVRVYTLTINNDDGHGTATVSPNQTKFAEGDEITVTSVPNSGYKFKAWLDGNDAQESTNDPYVFTMPASDKTLKVTFEESTNYYDITTAVSGSGSVTITVGGETHTGQQILEGTQVTLTATPAEGYGFVKWQDGNTDNSRTIFANAETQAITWTATFDQIHTVTTEFGKPGSEVTGGGTYPIGGQVTLEAFVSDKEYELDYNFSHWEQVSGTAPITGHENDNPLTFTMPAQNLTLKAIYAPVECVDTFVIQCETEANYIPYNKRGTDLTTYPHEIPHVDGCGLHSDYYTEYHGAGYYDFKEAYNCEMYYPVELPASTYKFEMWSATNNDKDCWMILYIESDDANPDVVYKEVSYKKTNSVKANNYGPDSWPFAISGTIENVVITSPKSVIIGLYCGSNYGAFDQIRITATDESKPFCHELSTETFTINSGETKEIPVCGVNNLIIYDGGQANNEENVKVKTSVKHIRQVKQLDVWEDFALPFTATSIQVEDPDDHNMYDIYPAIRQYNESTKGWDVKPGYFYMQELQHEEMATVIGTDFRQRWEHSQNLFPQVNTPYIIEFISTQSSGYFWNTFITYGMTGSTEVVGYDNATVDNGSWPQDGTKPTFHYLANNAVVPVVPYDAYVLSDDHTMFELKERPKILPFHCYIQASAETKAIAKVLRLVGGGGTPTTLVPIYTDAEHQNYKVMIDEVIYVVRDGKIYTVMGQLVK